MLRKLLRWLGYALAGLLVFVLVLIAGIFVVTEWSFAKTFDVDGHPIAAATGPEAIEEGQRLATVLGCNNGCHGLTGNGSVFFEVPDGSRVIAPDLHAVAATQSDLELERAIRHGVRPDGTSLFGPMPSAMFSHLTDRDLALVLAWMRSIGPREDEPLPDKRMGPMLRGMILRFSGDDFEPLAARAVDHGAPHGMPLQTAAQRGEYLATVTCSECHGVDLEGGGPPLNSPSLHTVKAYDLPAFQRLLRTGAPLDGRDLGLMKTVAEYRFSHFTDDEIADLHAFLVAR